MSIHENPINERIINDIRRNLAGTEFEPIKLIPFNLLTLVVVCKGFDKYQIEDKLNDILLKHKLEVAVRYSTPALFGTRTIIFDIWPYGQSTKEINVNIN